MTELADIAREAERLRAAGQTFLLATVVRTRGSSYRRPGARMLVSLDDEGQPARWLAGCVSGGCLEKDVLLRGAWRTVQGAALVTYDSTSDDEGGWGVGLGCNGVVDVLLERIDPGASLDPTRIFAECLAESRTGALVSVFESRHPSVPVGAHLAISAGVSSTIRDHRVEAVLRAAAEQAMRAPRPVARVVEVDGVSALVETLAPPPNLFLVGTHHDAVPLASLARAMGWTVTVCDVDGRRAGRFERPLIGPPAAIRAAVDATADAHVVLMTHSYERDRELVRALWGSKARYLGVLGPRHRSERILAELGLQAHPGLFAPVGLDLGAETPQEIALAIVAEIQASRRNAAAGFLREQVRPIHAPAKLVCAVLAAGGSRRLGRPKQLVRFRGEPLVRRAARTARASSCDEVAVVVGAAHQEIEAALADLDVACLPNPDWSEGIASSVRAAVAWARAQRADGLLLILADQPLLSTSHLDRLADELRGGAPAVGSAYAEVVGVPAGFAASRYDELDRLVGDSGAARVLRSTEGLIAVPWSEGSVDVDREQDVGALARLEVEAR